MNYKKSINKMTIKHSSTRLWTSVIGVFLALGMVVFPTIPMAAEPTNPLLREFSIKVDPSALNPPTWWHVPGVTPLIWTMDPINMEAYKTTEAKDLKLKPGEYRFGTFTFDFLFKVTLSGKLQYDETLDQCVNGRGTQVLTIHCSHTQPYPQDPDYLD